MDGSISHDSITTGSGTVAVGGGSSVAVGGGSSVAVGGGSSVAVGGGCLVAVGGGSSVAVGGGSSVVGTGVFVGLYGAEVGDLVGVRVRVGTTGVCVSVGVKVTVCVLVRYGVYDGYEVIVGLGV